MPSVQRSSLFFNQYQWCARFYMPECHALRRLDHRSIDRTIALRRRWGRRLIPRPIGSWQKVWVPMEISSEIESNLHVMCDFLLQDHTPRHIRIREDHMFVYSNDQQLFDRIDSLKLCKTCEVTGVQLTGMPDAVNLRSSDHSLRTYLRARRLSENTAKALRRFLLVQPDVRLSPSLTYWCDNHRICTQNHFFFDHHSGSTTNMLALIEPGLVKCTLPIITAK